MATTQYDLMLAFIKKLAQPTKTASAINLESWKEVQAHHSPSQAFDVGEIKKHAQIAIECRKLLGKMENLPAYPMPKRAVKQNTEITLTKMTIPVPNDVDDPEASLEDVEKAHIVRVLYQQAFNKTRAAKVLGITVKTLYNKLELYEIKLPSVAVGQPRRI